MTKAQATAYSCGVGYCYLQKPYIYTVATYLCPFCSGWTYTFVHTIISQSCWLHGCMLIMSYALQDSYNSDILTWCGIHWMAKSTHTRQCLLSHVSSGTRTLLNVHLFGEGISFVGAACFHRDCPDALAASSGNRSTVLYLFATEEGPFGAKTFC